MIQAPPLGRINAGRDWRCLGLIAAANLAFWLVSIGLNGVLTALLIVLVGAEPAAGRAGETAGSDGAPALATSHRA